MKSAEAWFKIENLSVHSNDLGQQLKGFNFSIGSKETTLILGQNPEQADILSKVLAGDIKIQTGSLIIDGLPRAWGDSALHKRGEIFMLEPNSIGHSPLRVYEQLAMEKHSKFQWWFNAKAWIKNAEELLKKFPMDIQPSQTLEGLSTFERRMIVLLGVLSKPPRLIVLRNFLAQCSSKESSLMESILKHYKHADTSILYTEHQLSHLPKNLDSVHLLKEGQVIFSSQAPQLDRMELTRLLLSPGPTQKNTSIDPKIFHQLLRYNDNILINLPIALILLDRHQRVQLSNTRALKLFETPPDLGQDFLSFIQVTNNALYQWLSTHQNADQEQTLASCEWQHPNGKKVISCRCYPILDQIGRIGSVLLLDDQTELERWRQQATTSELLKSTGFLAAGVAHEINNPLEIAKNYLESLNRTTASEQQSQAVKGISEEMEQIKQIVGQLVSYSSDQDEVIEPFCILDLIRNTTKLMSKYSSKDPSASSETPASTFSYKLLFQAQTLEMIGSPNQMRQILINLIKNAIEASSAHCEITIICHSLEQHDDPWVRIQIIDNGPGIPQTHIDQIFMPFYSDKFGSGKNMGIGLSLVQNMVDKAGGHIFAHSGSESFQDHVGHDKHIPPSLRSDMEDVSHRQNIGCVFSLEFPRCKESN